MRHVRRLSQALRRRAWPDPPPAWDTPAVVQPPDVPVPRSFLQPGTLVFRCNICGQSAAFLVEALERETASCDHCRSTVRYRGVIHLLSTELFGESLALQDFPVRKDITGLGLSDWEPYAERLAARLDYANTFLHQEPVLDITNIPTDREQTCDFLIATDVFEHVAPPIGPAFDNARRLLRAGGVLIFTVPYLPGSELPETREHFPELHDFRVFKDGAGRTVVENTTRDGQRQRFDDVIAHGGDGLTVEMRLFSEASLACELARAGFTSVRFCAEPNFQHGVYWKYPWSLPIVARA